MILKKNTILVAVLLSSCLLLGLITAGLTPAALLLVILFVGSLTTLFALRWQVGGCFSDAFLLPYGLIPTVLLVMLISRTFYYFWFFEAGIGVPPIVFTHSEYIGAATLGTALIMLFLTGYLSAGSVLSVRRWASPRQHSEPPIVTKNKPSTVLIISFSVVGLLGVSLILAKNNWQYINMVLNPAERTGFAQGTGYLQTLVRFLPAAFLLYVVRQSCGRRVNKIGLLCFIIVIFAALIPFGQRSQLFFPLLSILVLANFLTKGLSLRTLITVLIFAATSLGLFSAYRRVTSLGESNALEYLNEILNNAPSVFHQLTKGFNPIDSLFALVQGKQNLWLGETYLYVFFQAVPSALWPGKSAAYDSVGYIVSSNYLLGVDAGFPPTVVGELYLNFGAIGVFLGGFLLGLAVLNVTKYLINATGDMFRSYAFAVLAPSLFLLTWGTATIWVQIFIKDMIILGVVYIFWGRRCMG